MSSQVKKELHVSARSRRAARACARCHSRKVRCDGSITGFPCTNCRLDGRSCTLHSGKRDKEKQMSKAIARHGETIYPSPPSTSELHPAEPMSLGFVKSQGALKVPIQEVLDVFTKHYFLYVHPCLPVVDEAAFWQKYRCIDGSAGKISTLLFQAMLFAASSFVPLEAAKECGYDSLLSARDDLYRRAKYLYESGNEKDRLIISQASLLLTYYTTDAERATNSRWLRIAIQYAKKEQAHLYHRLPQDLRPGRRISDLKRLWWCCMIRDRIISLGMRRPIQITPDEFDLHQPGLSLQDLEEESFQSEVYPPDTKIELCRVVASLCHLVVAVTDLIMLVYPTTQNMPLSLSDRRIELNRLEETKFTLLDWELSWVANPDGKEYYIHPSLTLYTNLCAIYFQSARIALCNRICLLIGHNTYLADETDLSRIESCRAELASAIRSTADNVKQLILNGVADKLPISAVAYTLLPQILLSIQTQLSTTPEDKQLHEIMLVFFVEVFRCFRNQYYTRLILAVSWKALELCQSHTNPLLPATNTNTTASTLSDSEGNYSGDLLKRDDPNDGRSIGVDALFYYPSLFQLRLNEYNRLLRYVDEFMSLRRAPGEGVIYPSVRMGVGMAMEMGMGMQAQAQAQIQEPPSSSACIQAKTQTHTSAMAAAISPQETDTTSPSTIDEYEIGEDQIKPNRNPELTQSVDQFLFAYFGESELGFAEPNKSLSFGQIGSDPEPAGHSKSSPGSMSLSRYSYDPGAGAGAGAGLGIGRGKDACAPASSNGLEGRGDHFQNMLDCLPLLGE
ncbi:fungal-specific transcription factor domain-containing protein [Aspergillus californicus]